MSGLIDHYLKRIIWGGSGLRSIGVGPFAFIGSYDTFDLLPDPVSNAGRFAYVINTTGVPFVTRKRKGLYRSDGVSWLRSSIEVYFSDATFQIYNATDPTKIAIFDSSIISSAITRTFQFPDKDGTIALTNDVDNWLNTFIQDTPSSVIRLWGKSAQGFKVGFNVRILELHVQYLSEDAVQSALRVRAFRYDAGSTTDREILNITVSAMALGYHNEMDITPDTNYYDTSYSAGDTVWIEIDNGAGNAPVKVSEITINLRYQRI